MKSLANNEIKISLSSSDNYLKLRTTLENAQQLPEAEKKELGVITFHTYRLQEEKPFTVFVRGLHYITDMEDITREHADLGHMVKNIINVHIEKRADNKVCYQATTSF